MHAAASWQGRRLEEGEDEQEDETEGGAAGLGGPWLERAAERGGEGRSPAKIPDGIWNWRKKISRSERVNRREETTHGHRSLGRNLREPMHCWASLLIVGHLTFFFITNFFLYVDGF